MTESETMKVMAMLSAFYGKPKADEKICYDGGTRFRKERQKRVCVFPYSWEYCC